MSQVGKTQSHDLPLRRHREPTGGQKCQPLRIAPGNQGSCLHLVSGPVRVAGLAAWDGEFCHRLSLETFPHRHRSQLWGTASRTILSATNSPSLLWPLQPFWVPIMCYTAQELHNENSSPLKPLAVNPNSKPAYFSAYRSLRARHFLHFVLSVKALGSNQSYSVRCSTTRPAPG